METWAVILGVGENCAYGTVDIATKNTLNALAVRRNICAA